MKKIKCLFMLCFLLLMFSVLKAQSTKDTALVSEDTSQCPHVELLKKQIIKSFLDSATYPQKSKQIGEQAKIIIKIIYKFGAIKEILVLHGGAVPNLLGSSLAKLIPIFFEQLYKNKLCGDVHEITFSIIFMLGEKKMNEEKDGIIYVIEKDPVKITKRKMY